MKNPTPVVALPVIDRLAFVLPWGLGALVDQAQIVDEIRQRLTLAIAAGRCELAYPRGSRYRLNFRIKLDGGGHALVQVGALQPNVQKGGIRILVNPAKWLAGDVDQLHRTLERLIGDQYRDLMLRPRINVLDIAVDILHANLRRLLVTYTNAQRRTVICKYMAGDRRVETYNFGSASSDYIAAVYDKHTERVHAAIKQIARHGLDGESLKANLLKQFLATREAPEKLRIEIRGKKMKGKSLFEIPHLANRFERFSFTDLDGDGSALSELMQAALIAMVQQYDLKTTLKLFANSGHARKVRKFLNDRQVDWWEPRLMWQQACEALKCIGLFEARAFNEYQSQSSAFDDAYDLDGNADLTLPLPSMGEAQIKKNKTKTKRR